MTAATPTIVYRIAADGVQQFATTNEYVSKKDAEDAAASLILSDSVTKVNIYELVACVAVSTTATDAE